MKPITREEVELIHAVYDPAKAHEYYLKNRELKGRVSGGLGAGGSGFGKSVAKPKAAPKRSGAQYARKPLANKGGMDKAQAKARIASIQKRLGTLQNVLKDLMAQKSKEDAESKKKSSTKKKSSGTKSDPKRQLTAKQKADNRERSKDYYEEHKETTKKKSSTKKDDDSLDQKIELVKNQIKQTKAELAAAKAKAGIK